MWTLVNASYGIAMGQRPMDTGESHDQRRRRPSTTAAMLSIDPRQEAAQARRRDHLAQAADEQWAEDLVPANHGRAPHKSAPRWAQAVWWCLRGAGETRGLFTRFRVARAE